MRYLIALIAERLLDDKQRRLLDKYYRRGRHSKRASYFGTYYSAFGGRAYA